MGEEMKYNDIVKASEEAIRNTSGKTYFVPDNMNFKMTNELFFILANAVNSKYELSVVYWLIKSMNKANVVNGINHSELIRKSGMARATYYKVLKRLEEADFMVIVNKSVIMVNPEVIINHRKSSNKERPQLLTLWSEYKRQQMHKLTKKVTNESTNIS